MIKTSEGEKTHHKVFIGGLDRKVLEENVQDYFTDLGPIYDFELKKKKATAAYSLGYAILTTDKSTFNKLISGPPLFFEGRKIECKPFLSGEELTQFNIDFNKRRIYVNDLQLETTDQNLNEIFSVFGEIDNAYIIIDFETRKPNGKGFVLFKDGESAKKATSEPILFNGSEINCTFSNKLSFLTKKSKEQKKADKKKKRKRKKLKKKLAKALALKQSQEQGGLKNIFDDIPGAELDNELYEDYKDLESTNSDDLDGIYGDYTNNKRRDEDLPRECFPSSKSPKDRHNKKRRLTFEYKYHSIQEDISCVNDQIGFEANHSSPSIVHRIINSQKKESNVTRRRRMPNGPNVVDIPAEYSFREAIKHCYQIRNNHRYPNIQLRRQQQRRRCLAYRLN